MRSNLSPVYFELEPQAIFCRLNSSKTPNQTKTLTQKVKTLRRRLVFKLACKVMRRRFHEAGLGAGNDPNPPPGPVAVKGFQDGAAGIG